MCCIKIQATLVPSLCISVIYIIGIWILHDLQKWATLRLFVVWNRYMFFLYHKVITENNRPSISLVFGDIGIGNVIYENKLPYIIQICAIRIRRLSMKIRYFRWCKYMIQVAQCYSRNKLPCITPVCDIYWYQSGIHVNYPPDIPSLQSIHGTCLVLFSMKISYLASLLCVILVSKCYPWK